MIKSNLIPAVSWLFTQKYSTAVQCSTFSSDETHIVTAAHCVEGYNWFEVITGAHNPFEMEDTQQRQIVQVSAATVHESYNPFTIDNDIAILKLNPPLEFNGKSSHRLP